jgi:addiction module HigA family antidote
MTDAPIKIDMESSSQGEFVREEILEPLGLSVARAAAVLGVRRATLSDLVHGNAGLSPGMAPRIEKAFGVSMDTLLRMPAWHNRYTIRQLPPQAGAPSGYRGSPSLIVSHACLLEVQMCSVGWKSSGISKLPHVRPITPALVRSVNNEVPQTVQKPRTRTGEEFRRPSAPVIVTAFKGISTRALNAAPSDR